MGPRPEIARQLRRFVLDALERGNLQFGLVIIDCVAVLIWEDDPRTAYLLPAIYRRAWAVNPMLPAEARSHLDPAEIAELDDRAATMPDRDALALALGALDRYLQTEQG